MSSKSNLALPGGHCELHPLSYRKRALGQSPRPVVVGWFIGEHAQPSSITTPHFHTLLRIHAVEFGFGHLFKLRFEKFASVAMAVDLEQKEFSRALKMKR